MPRASESESETKFRKRICRKVREMGGIIIPYVGSAMQFRGVPDIYLAHNRYCGFIEFKGEETKLQPIQTKVMMQLREKGCKAYIVRAPCLICHPAGEIIEDFESVPDLLVKLGDL